LRKKAGIRDVMSAQENKLKRGKETGYSQNLPSCSLGVEQKQSLVKGERQSTKFLEESQEKKNSKKNSTARRCGTMDDPCVPGF